MFWSLPLARALILDLPEGALGSAGSSALGGGDEELAEASIHNLDLRRGICAAWRREQGAPAEQIERLPVEELGSRAPQLVREHGERVLLLAVLSEAGEDTLENVELMLQAMAPSRERKRLLALWQGLQSAPAGAREPRRVAVFGGSSTEKARIRRIEDRFGLRVHWIPADRDKGFGQAQASLAQLSAVEAMLVVTGRISHTVMQSARETAVRLGIPCFFIERLSERQVDSWIDEWGP